MFKLVAIAGKLRGEEFTLVEGDNVCGREEDLTVSLSVDGISKQHFSINVKGETAFLKDLDSSNGTYLNGKLIKSATIQNGDKISLPDLILQVVYVEEKKIIIKKVADGKEEEVVDDFSKPPPKPKNLGPTLLWLFKYKLVIHLNGLNREYQWRAMSAISFAVFVFLTMYLTIFPAIEYGDTILISEVAQRGKLYAEEIARLNAKALEKKQLDMVDTSFIENNKEVKFELFDLQGRVVRPFVRMNEYIQDPFSVKAQEWAARTMNESDSTQVQILGSGVIGIAAKIMAYNPRTGTSEAVGVIALRFKPKSIQDRHTMMIFLKSLISSGGIAAIFFGIFYFLTLRPLEELKYLLDDAIRSGKRGIEPELKFEELNPLKNSINSLIQRYREADRDSDDDTFDEVEESGPYIETMVEFMNGAHGAVMILDQDKNVVRINTPAEDCTGIRESGSEGMSLLDVAREQGLAATVIELCDGSADNSGTSQSGNYELQGNDYSVFVNALMGKDGFAKCFYISFVRDE
tara:strand:+ start:5958 stop:7514 length:1557 start_codon:yes stop_codon:yes gene_type:complete